MIGTSVGRTRVMFSVSFQDFIFFALRPGIWDCLSRSVFENEVGLHFPKIPIRNTSVLLLHCERVLTMGEIQSSVLVGMGGISSQQHQKHYLKAC